MLKTLIAGIALALYCIEASPAQSWSIGDQPFPTLLSRLPKSEREAILRGLQPGIARRAKEFDLDEADITSAKKDLRVQKVIAETGPLTLVQGYGMEFCGAVGNCAVWGLDKTNRLILETGGNGIQILKTSHHGYPSLLMFGHISASQTDMTWYSFNGSHYVRVKCAVQTYSDSAQVPLPSKVEYGPCDK